METLKKLITGELNGNDYSIRVDNDELYVKRKNSEIYEVVRGTGADILIEVIRLFVKDTGYM